MITKLSTTLLIALIFMMGCTNAQKKGDASKPVALEAKEFKEALAATPGAVLIDVRTPEEVSGGIIKGAINIDYQANDFNEKIATLDKEKPYFVYCLSGIRSGNAAEEMEEAGFKKIFTLDDGLKQWKQKGFEIVKP